MLKTRVFIGILVLMITGGMPAYTWGDTIPPAVTPSAAGGTYTSSQSVKLTANETALIYYTTNGSDPTTASSVYTTPIIVNTSLTLKYFAVDGAGNASSIQTQTYVIAGGDVRAWGDNQYGQLGDGTFTDSSIPLQAGGFVDVVEVSGGAFHTIILRKDGTVWAWGGNNAGQLGDGTKIDSPVPVQVSGLANVVAIDGGISHSIALKNDGTVWTWGSNNFGQLGDGTQIDRTVPVQVSGLTGIAGIAGGRHHSIALKNDGTVWTWGRNKEGQLGNGTSLDYILLPVGVTGLTNIVAVAAGDFHSLSVSNDGTVWAWGRNNNGELGDGTTINRTTPVHVSGLSNVAAAIAGANPHTLALKGDGTVWAWGRNSEGQLGNGTTIDSSVPVQVNDLANGVAIAAGVYHSIALMNDGTVWTWGSNINGELGDGTFINSPVPVQASSTSYISAIAGGGYHTIAIRQDTAPPTGSVVINGDATATNSTSVNLVLLCTDTGTGCAQMRFSNDDIAWSEWEPYAPTKAWIMATGDGGKTVYVQLMDVIGNVSESYMDAIILDTTPPRTTASPAAGGFPGPLTVTLTTDEPATIYYTTDGSAPSAASSIYSGPISITENTTLKYFAVDSLGNQESVKTGSYGINVIDLIVSALSAPSSIYTGVSYTVSNTVKNIGNISSTTSYLKIYLSTDAIIDSSDTYLAQRSVSSLSWGASNSANTTIKLPVTLSPGTYYIGAIADANNTNVEFDETNNTASTTAITVQSGIDFVVSSFSAPSAIYTGLNATISNTVTNNGVGATASSYLKIYLSTDSTIDSSDLYLTQRSISSLNGGISSSASTTVKLPVTLIPGTYYIGAIADATYTNVESSESNNTAATGAITVLSGVDLTVSSLSAPSTIETGVNVSISNTVTNNGVGATASSYLKIYLSTDSTIDSSDLYLAQRSVSSLNGGISSSASTTVKLPVTLSPGTYYIGAIADATGTNLESDETNNTAVTGAIAVTSGVDLTVSSLSAPSAIYTGLNATISNTVTNNGVGATASSYLKIYLSTDSTIDSSDLYLAQRSVSSLNGGISSSASTTVKLPVTLSPGTYYIGAIADATGTNLESDETNNTAVTGAIAVTSGVDLTVSSLSAPSAIETGVNVFISNTVANLGPGATATSYVKFYLSTDENIDTTDTYLTQRSISSLAGGASSSATTTITLSVTTVPGTYYIGAIADATGTNLESDETNNTAVTGAITVTSGVDLIVSSITAPSSAVTGSSVSVANTVKNNGTGTSTTSYVKFYLSTDENIDTTDTYLTQRSISSLSGGASSSATTTITLSVTTVPGTYYIGAIADATGTNLESDETNNTAVTGAITVTSGVDLVVSALSAPGSAVAGTSISIPNTVSNLGSGASASSYIKFYLSADTIVDISDIYLGQRSVGSLVGGASSSVTTNLNMPASTVAGTYYIGAIADATYTNVELDETNNTATTTPVIITSP